MAVRVVGMSRLSSDAAATAAPVPPLMAVPDEATDPSAGGTVSALQRRHDSSTPSVNAVRRAVPEVGSALLLCDCERGGRNWSAWVNDRLLVCVVEAVNAGGEAVDQRGMKGVGFAAAANKVAFGAPAKRLRTVSARSTPESRAPPRVQPRDVEEGAQDLLPNGLRQVGIACFGRVGGELGCCGVPHGHFEARRDKRQAHRFLLGGRRGWCCGRRTETTGRRR